MMRPLSIRARLALWYGAAVALSLALFAAAGFAFIARTSLGNMDASLDEALDAVQGALALEAGAHHPNDADVRRVVQDFRFRDLKIAMLDRATSRTFLGESAGAADSGSDVVAAEDVRDDPDQDPEPNHPEEEDEHRPQDVEKRVIRRYKQESPP